MIFFVTTAPAPITTPLHISTGRMVALDPIDTLSPITVDFQSDWSPFDGPPVVKLSFMNMTP